MPYSKIPMKDTLMPLFFVCSFSPSPIFHPRICTRCIGRYRIAPAPYLPDPVRRNLFGSHLPSRRSSLHVPDLSAAIFRLLSNELSRYSKIPISKSRSTILLCHLFALCALLPRIPTVRAVFLLCGLLFSCLPLLRLKRQCRRRPIRAAPVFLS